MINIKNTEWVKEEIKILKEMASNGYMDKEIGKKLERTESAISNKRYKLGINLIKLDENLFNEWNNNNVWVLGFITADGSFNKKNRPNDITVYNTDLQLIKEIRKIFKTKKSIYNIKNKGRFGKNPVFRLQISSKKIVEFLKSINAYGTKEERNPFPIVPDQYKWSFIKGYFDGDGNIYEGKLSIAGRHEIIKYMYYWMCHQIRKYPNKIYTASTSDITKYFQFSESDSNKLFYLMNIHSSGTYNSQKFLKWKDYYKISAVNK